MAGWGSVLPRPAPTAGRHALLASVAAIAVGSAIGFLEPTVDACLIASIAIVVVAPLILRASRGEFDVFEPYFFFALAYTAMFVIRPTAMAIKGDYVYAQSLTSVEPYFTAMLGMALLGAVAFVGGYHSDLGRRVAAFVPTPPANFRMDIAVRSVILTGLLGVALYTLYLASLGGLGQIALILAGRSPELRAATDGVAKYFFYGPLMLIPAAVIAIGLGVEQRSRLWIAGGVAAVGVILLLALPQGSRGTLMPLVLPLVVVPFLRRQRRPSLTFAVAAIVCGLAFSFVVLQGRNADAEGRENLGTTATSVLTKPWSIFQPITEGPDAEMAHALAAAMSVAPSQIPRQYGLSTFGDLLFRPVPRAVWPEKPRTPRQQVITELAPGRFAAGQANPEMSALLTPYLDFGVLGGLILAFYGVVARALFVWFKRSNASIAGQLLLALCLPFTVLGLRDSLTDTTMRLVFVVGPAILAFAVATRSGRRHTS